MNNQTYSLESELAQELQQLDSQQLKRTLRVVDQLEGASISLDGKTYLNFSSNNYLGLARHPQVLEAVRQVLDHWGPGATSSRLISGNTIIHRDLEQALAAFMRTEAVLIFPTGYMANVGVLTALAGDGDAIIMDRLCHASLIDAARLSGARLFVYAHADVAEAERALKRTTEYRRRLLVTDSLFSMDGDFAPLEELSNLAQRCEALSILDEAHAVGVWGDGGRGARSAPARGRTGATSEKEIAQPPPRRIAGASYPPWDVVIGTLSKSLGSQGGFVCGSQALIDTLINKARSFIYTTGLSPACVAAAHAALSVIQEDPGARRRLVDLAAKLRTGLRDLGFNILKSDSQIVPIWLGSVEAALACSGHLESAGIFAPAIRPPTVHAGQCRIRFSVTAEHKEEDVERLISVLRQYEQRRDSGGLTGTAD